MIRALQPLDKLQMGSLQAIFFVKPVGGGSILVASDLQIAATQGTGSLPGGGQQQTPRPAAPARIGHDQFLDFGHWAKVVQQILDVQAQKTNGLPADFGQPVINVLIAQILKIHLTESVGWIRLFLQFLDQSPDNANIAAISRANLYR